MAITIKPTFRRRVLRGGVQALGLLALGRIAVRPVRAEAPLRIGIQKGGSLFLLRERGELPKVLVPYVIDSE